MEHINPKELIQTAYNKGTAIAAINVSNMETVTAVLRASEKTNLPVILQVAPLQKEIQGFSYGEIVSLIHMIAQRYKTGGYSIHLDHAENTEDCKAALNGGFDSVMYDGATLPLEKNIVNSKIVRTFAKGGMLETELGVLATDELGQESGIPAEYTHPSMAKEFVAKTKTDCLAVSIGNAHGHYKKEPKLNFEILKEINQSTNLPLVLHGATGLSKETLQKAIRLGIAKINFFTEVDSVFKEAFCQKVASGAPMMRACKYAEDKMCETVVNIINMCSLKEERRKQW